MVTDSSQPLDHDGDAVQGPQLTDKPVGSSALQQGLLDVGELGELGELGVGDLRGGAGRAAAAQGVDAIGLPALCQRWTPWRETPSWRATSAWRTPAANNSAARSRRS
jgi:hypothetical protein